MKSHKLFFKFNKFSFIELGWTLISLASDVAVMLHWKSNFFTVPHIIYFIVAFAITCFGVYRTYESFSTYKIRLDDYYKITEMFEKYGVKKSLLYHLQETPCGATVTEQLMKDFDVKDIKVYTDDLK